jgi:acetate kinase
VPNVITRNNILILNLGSTSIKGVVFKIEQNQLNVISTFSKKLSDITNIKDFLLDQTKKQEYIKAIAFRVVHGGKNYPNSVLMSSEIISAIKEAEKLAPLHNSILIKWVEVLKKIIDKDILIIACFDSSFFYDMPDLSKAYPISKIISAKFGIQKLGFHGFAHQSMLAILNDQTKSKIITLQLGGGCSIAAILNGRPIETSMGYTPLEGLMMGTRSGSIDPGIIFYLQKEGMTACEVETLLNSDSGFKGLVGTNDMQKIIDMNTADSVFAIDLFCRNIAKTIGAYITLLGGINTIIFGGGIGEHCPLIRKKIIKYLDYLSISINDELNNNEISNFFKISDASSKAEIFIIKPEEEIEMAKAANSFLLNIKQN